MDYISFFVTYLIAFISVYLLIYFQIFSELKKLESLIKGDGIINKIKRYFLKNSLKEIKAFNYITLILFGLFILLSIVYLYSSSFKKFALLLIYLIIFIHMLFLLILIINYNRVYRDLNTAINNSSKVPEFFSLFGIEKKKSQLISKMIDICKGEENLLEWFLDSIIFKEKVLLEVKEKKRK